MEGLESHKFSVQDKSTSDLTEIFETASNLIHELIQNNKSILIHCKGGINRSPIVVIAYLCKFCQYSVPEAIAHVTQRRKGVRIQPHYLLQLTAWLEEESRDHLINEL